MNAAHYATAVRWQEPPQRTPWLIPRETGSGIRACICFAVTFLTRHKESA